MRPLVLLAMVSAGFLPATSQTPGFAIAGQVVRHADDHPVRGARVSIAPVEQRDRRVFCRSGENGQFSFSGVSAGKYSLAVTDHEWSQAYKQFDYFSTAIAVGPGLDSEHIVFRLESPASIVGSVLDDAGDPVRGAMVYLFGRFLSRGAYQTGMKGTVNTNADGSFHFTRVAPGTYYVAVSGRPWYAQNPPTTRPEIVRQPGVPETVGLGGPQNQPASQPDLDVAYPVTYYQNATSPEAATPLKLEEGQRADIKFNLQPVPALHIALDGVPKDPDQQIFGQLSQVGPGGSLIQVQAMPMNSEIVGVAPGNYVLSANLYGQKQPVTTGSQTVTLSSNSTVSLSNAVKTCVHGKVILDGQIPQGLAVALKNSAVSVAHDGSFAFETLQPGRYSLFLANTSDLYMRTVTVKGGTFSNGELEVAAGADVELTITAARGLSKVEGIVKKDDKPVEGAMVLLITQDFSHGKYIPRDQSDSDGTFTLSSAPPGRYKLVAIDDGQDLEYANPAVIAPYLEHGRVIDVPVPSSANIEVKVQQRKQ